MNNIYYMIWGDAIKSYRKHNPNKKEWKTTLLFFVSFINAINLWILLIWLKYFNILTIPVLTIDLFPGNLLDSFLEFTIEFILPLGIINYFLVFYKKRYEKIVLKYKDQKTRYASIYSKVVVCVALLSAYIVVLS